MATAAPITGAPMRAPSIDRRGLLGRIALAPAIAFPLPALATPTRSASVSPEMAALLGEYRRADQEQDRQHDRDYLPRYKAAHGEVDALPHTIIEVCGQRYSTSVNAHVQAARHFARSCSLPGEAAPWRKLLAAHLWRERASRRIFERTGLTAALRENDRLGDVRLACEAALVRFRASSAIDLRAKLAFMIEHDMNEEPGWLTQILEDVERIVAMEGR